MKGFRKYFKISYGRTLLRLLHVLMKILWSRQLPKDKTPYVFNPLEYKMLQEREGDFLTYVEPHNTVWTFPF